MYGNLFKYQDSIKTELINNIFIKNKQLLSKYFSSQNCFISIFLLKYLNQLILINKLKSTHGYYICYIVEYLFFINSNKNNLENNDIILIINQIMFFKKIYLKKAMAILLKA